MKRCTYCGDPLVNDVAYTNGGAYHRRCVFIQRGATETDLKFILTDKPVQSVKKSSPEGA